jgi:BMFP domain-containing protein YqiC
VPRVKISYGVELDQIPEEVQNLFDGVGEWMHTLSKQSDTIEDLLETEELEACVSVMNKMRETLSKMDARIEDLSSILTGYNAYMKQNGAKDDSPERRPVVDTTSSDVVQGAEESYGSDDESGT